MIKELDVVRLTKDLPEQRMLNGAQGTVHQVYDTAPPAYLIEFNDEDADELELLVLTADVVELI